MSETLLYTSGLALSLPFVYLLYKQFKGSPLSDIPGPRTESFLTGNCSEVYLSDCGEGERALQQQFGSFIRIKAALGEDRLWVSDPKALQHILVTSGYNYPKTNGQRVVGGLLTDHGLAWAEGDAHRRQRKAMLPAFGMPETKAFVPIFQAAADKMCDQWGSKMSNDNGELSSVIDVTNWLMRATLDAIGIAAFDYDFGALEDTNNPLTQSYQNLFINALSEPSAIRIIWENVADHLPYWVINSVYSVLPSANFQYLRRNLRKTRKVATELYQEKKNDIEIGASKRDVMSLLVKANNSQSEKARLFDEEIIPQMQTIMLAGHETTANTMCWCLYELAKKPEIQSRLREEILEARARALARGDEDLNAADFDSMPYTVAVMKETLRLDAVAMTLFRQAAKDDIIPLHTPITTVSGNTISQVAVPKGTKIVVSLYGYQLNPDIWGADAHEFNPERWLNTGAYKDLPAVGLYGNLLVFSAGTRGCIGWRFAVTEFQSMLTKIIPRFEFSIPEGAKDIRRERSGVMTPMVVGEREAGAQLPLKLTALSN